MAGLAASDPALAGSGLTVSTWIRLALPQVISAQHLTLSHPLQLRFSGLVRGLFRCASRVMGTHGTYGSHKSLLITQGCAHKIRWVT
jgi:hypothetical protein